MNLYLMRQNDNTGYQTYDSCVVCAESIEDAKSITPDDEPIGSSDSGWALKKEAISCVLIGKANKEQKRDVILSSYNLAY